MKNSSIKRFAAVAVAASCIGIASAQSNGASGLSVRVGAFFPSSDSAQNLGNTWFVFGADFKLGALSNALPSAGGLTSWVGISADYYYRNSDSDIPVALTYNLRQGQMVYMAGIGPDFRNAGDLTSTGVGLSEQLGVSYEFGNMPTPVFIQAKYFFASRPELSGLGVYVGVRF